MLGLYGGGRRARSTAAGAEEKIIYFQHSLATSRSQAPQLPIPMFQAVAKEVDQLVERMRQEVDGTRIKKTIEQMTLKRLNALKDKMRSMQLTERTMYMLAGCFFEEAALIERLINSLEKLLEVAGNLFNIQMIRSFWVTTKSGEVQFSAVRTLIEDRARVIEVLTSHGVVMSDV